MQLDRTSVHFEVLVIAAVCAFFWGASPVAADTLYAYSHPFETTSGTLANRMR